MSRVALSLLSLLAALLFTEVASAHGERNQEPFLRMRSAHFFDVTWSKTKLAVNEEIVVEGKFRLFKDWPVNLPKPNVVFLGNGTPGPVFARVESWINGQPAIQSMALKRDRDYTFKTVLKARIPGRHHVHPMLNVDGAGPLLGPGDWVEVSGRAADFKLPVTTLDGTHIENLEHWATGRVKAWHAIWLVIALAWLGYWIRRPLLIPRYVALREGNEKALVSHTDLAVGAGLIVVVVALVVGGFVYTEAEYPRTIPLQGGRAVVEATPKSDAPVTVIVDRATYDVPGRSMKIAATITNGGQHSIQFGEFATSNLRFINRAVPAAVAHVDPRYPKELLPRNGLKVADTTPLAPGETRKVELEMTDAAWETERLTSLINDPDNRVGGLLFCYDDRDERLVANVSGSIVPVFMDVASAQMRMTH
ncbi:MAG: methane monooxygenase/ammonia monooxygenase subunit B [Gammaproteobacteria bacterium]|nr:methane monooxygenase/ammonia monooxygenase subunit B [Gammaproteobacteria bacterium]